jgi:hypothetical protein
VADSTPLNALVAERFAIGAGAWLAPRLSGRLFGFDPDSGGELPYLSRLFAVRDLALGTGALMSEGDARRTWLRIGIACDAADVGAGLIGGSRGQLSPFTTVLVTAAAVAAAGFGVAALGAVEDGAPA